MQLTSQVEGLVEQLVKLLGNLADDEYTLPVAVMGNASIGQHLRHIIEFFQELVKGYDEGHVYYHKRKRDLQLETDRSFAVETLAGLVTKIHLRDKGLLVFTDEAPGPDAVVVRSSYGRELMYNIDHTVHHMALIRVAVNLVAKGELPADFGVASSTLHFRKGLSNN